MNKPSESPNAPMELLGRILDQLEGPLLFTTGLDQSRLPHIKNIDSLVVSHVKRLREEIAKFPQSLLKEELLRISLKLLEGYQGYGGFNPSEMKVILDEGLRYVSEMKSLLKRDHENNKRQRLPGARMDGVSPANLLQSVLNVRRIGPRTGTLLARKKIITIEDLLNFLPRTYEDRREICPISETKPGIRQTVVGKIRFADIRFYGKRRIFEIEVDDGHGTLKGKWFKGREAIFKGVFEVGKRVILTGKVSGFPFEREMIHPDFEIIDENEDQLLHFKRIVPVYSETEGLHQKNLRRMMWQAVRDYGPFMNSPIPQEIVRKRDLIEIGEAIRQVHFPLIDERIEPYLEANSKAHRRLIYDECFFFQVGIALRKKEQEKKRGIPFRIEGSLLRKFYELMPFKLTLAQRRVIQEIEQDMASPKIMNRLLQGDVGSGKTVVAMAALITACENGYQGALMAPTEILAKQHFQNLKSWSNPLQLRVDFLSASTTEVERRELLGRLACGQIDILVGTHALIQEGVVFKDLGLAVIDEQHRFGVMQRDDLRKKGGAPDLLVMTATPIPRTLAMTVYGDLDISVIDELPPGKIPTKTKVFSEKQRERVYQIIRRELQKGHQVFIVYPLVLASENLDLKDATRMAEFLQKEIFQDYRIGLIHGRMNAESRGQVMADFNQKKIQVLVSTTVIEVGIDIPDASLMVIEHAERFGLSQLHQLRGRVGRGNVPSSCILIAKMEVNHDARKRLKIMEDSNDGFYIAEEDLALRGPGEFMGTRQSGFPDFRIFDPIRDTHMMSNAKTDAFALLEDDPGLELNEHLHLKQELLRRWEKRDEG